MQSDGPNYSKVLSLLLRLRQVCNCMSLVNELVQEEEKSSVDSLADFMSSLSLEKRCSMCCVELNSGTLCNDCKKMTSEDSVDFVSSKSAKVVELIQSTPKDSKVIIFTQFVKMIQVVTFLLFII